MTPMRPRREAVRVSRTSGSRTALSAGGTGSGRHGGPAADVGSVSSPEASCAGLSSPGVAADSFRLAESCAKSVGSIPGRNAAGRNARVRSASLNLSAGGSASLSASTGPQPGPAAGGGAERGASGAVRFASSSSVTLCSIRSVASGSNRSDGSRRSNPLITGHNSPHRTGGSGSSVATAISVASAPLRSNGGRPSTTA